MSNKLIIANWKMHFTVGESSLYLLKLQEKVATYRDVDVVLCPSILSLQSLSLQIDRRKFKLGAQNCYFKDEGAFTGEVSATMLRNLTDFILVGHSERRHVFGESDKQIAHKVQAVVRNGMTAVLCVGETKQERTDNETNQVLHAQVTAGLANVTTADLNNIVIAYEPVWAIGTGNFAKVDDASSAANAIRKQIEGMFGSKVADKVRILYGGSVDGDNAGGYLAARGVDGLLIGGASLNAYVMSKIVDKAHELQAK